MCIDRLRLNGTWTVTKKFSILLKYKDGEYGSCLVNVGALLVRKLHCKVMQLHNFSTSRELFLQKFWRIIFVAKYVFSFQTFERLACIMNESSVRRLGIPWRFANPLPICCVHRMQ